MKPKRTLRSVVLLLVLLAPPARADYSPITKPISSSEVELYTRWLRLSNEQGVIVRSAFEDYRRERDSTLRPLILEYHQRGDEILQRAWESGENPGRVLGEEVPDLDREWKGIQAQADLLDQRFLAIVTSLLTDEQRPREQRLHLGRLRIRLRADTHLPEGSPDLVEMVESLGLDDQHYNRIEMQFIRGFEPRFVELLTRNQKAKEERTRQSWEVYDLDWQAMQLARAFDETGDGSSLVAQRQLRADSRDILERISRARIAAAEELVALNREGLFQLIELLPQEHAPLFHANYYSTAYPVVYRDPSDARRLYEAALDAPDLSEETRAAVEVRISQYRISWEALSEEMAEAVHHRIWCVLAGRNSRAGSIGALWEKLRIVGEDRERLSASQIHLLRPLLTQEQFARLPEWDFIANPRPRPWDPVYEKERKHREERAERERLANPEELENERAKPIDNGPDDDH